MGSRHAKVIIIGAGPAGYTAGIYAARAMLNPLLIEGIQPGGQMTITTDVENYPGFADVIQGPWLMDQMRAQAEHVGTEMVADMITEVDLKQRPFRLKGDSGTEYTTDAVIIATGAKARWLDLPSEQKFQGFGVSACATCDGFFYRGQTVAVIGGGNTALEEALYLSNLAETVYLVHRRDKFRGEKILQNRVLEKDNIQVIWNSTLEEVLGEDLGVTGMKIRAIETDAVTEIPLQGVFIAIGHTPNTSLFENQLTMENGYLSIASGLEGGATATSIPGIFAAGDVADHIYRQAVTSAGFGCMAALDAEKYLDELA